MDLLRPLQGYGMTEAGPVLSMCLAFAKEPFEVKSGACGSVVRNAEMKIVDPETGASLGPNQRGEICIRGAQIMKGELTASSLPPFTCNRVMIGLNRPHNSHIHYGTHQIGIITQVANGERWDGTL